MAAPAAAAPVHVAHVTADLVLRDNAIAPGKPFDAGLSMVMDPGWHIYWVNPGDAGLPTTLAFTLPPGFAAGPLEYPAPHRLEALGATNYGYEGQVLLPVRLTAPAVVTGAVTLTAHASWLACAQVCVPGAADLSTTGPVSAAPVPDAAHEAAFAGAEAGLPRAVPGWRFVAQQDAGGYSLTATPPPGQHAAGPFFFFSEDGQVLQNGALQPTGTRHGALTATLVRMDGSAAATHLRGVWVAQGGWGGGGNAALIDAVVAPAAPAPPPPATGLLPALLLALLGGAVLNLMPCVFPVLGLKILGFANQAGADRRRIVAHGLAFTGGVLVSFWVLAGLLAALRAGGEQLGWGFQLQSPAFVFVLAAIMLAFGLNLSGVFEFGLTATRAGGAGQGGGIFGTFCTGLLATLVATPCSAPFLAPALGAAMAMPVAGSFLMFTAIGLGLSLPYLLLSAFPGAVRLLPRPGRWMLTMKQALAFPLYATAAYLLWVLAGQLSADGLLSAAWGLVCLAAGLWAYGHLQQRPARAIPVAALLLLAGLWLGWPQQAAGPIDWQPWSAEAVARARAENRVVYVDFTARWCATCQANKKLVFHSPRVLRAFAGHSIVTLRADWTSKDPAVTAELARFHRAAIPFNLVYRPGAAQPIVLPELLTPDAVLKAVG